jgi:hemerythrin-like domain-containing protein
MEPIGVLMKEHRLIERMLRLLETECNDMKKTKKINTDFLKGSIEFFQMYADKNHHSKEEEILFFALDKKKMNFEHRRIMSKLIEDHKTARITLNALNLAANRYSLNDKNVYSEIVFSIDRLLTLYPKHIELEDKHFFYPAMTYFTEEERNQMLEEFFEFDAHFDHERYQRMVEEYERGEIENVTKT